MAAGSMNKGDGAKSLHTAFMGKEYTLDGSALDLVAESPDGTMVPRRIIVLSAPASSTLKVTYVGIDGQAEGDKDSDLSADLYVGLTLVDGIKAIRAGTTATIKIHIAW